MGVPASGRHFSAVGAGIVRVVEGKVAQFSVPPNRMTIMEQIGALPALAQSN
jgi:hypothetical protein